ncbi:phospholipase D family protein [Herbaspirillum sp. SJZ130]|uniref:phospholipase D family nuclease n=1 Tax=unclassified Herbaspirillum TaxID=2624150 RepID=UPI00116BFBEF|nr:phosphatidylserine/phosphatidylglycerophosphate/cardiolipin synthase-like enzyme [Herbaspirillum sp. SJZ102]TQK08753.1 phospholipase D-like protein [Herbaspirillum sp. SJZ130]TQK14560.1 phospholipase D-like protein [Herbaspirillum sp. SJZ106]
MILALHRLCRQAAPFLLAGLLAAPSALARQAAAPAMAAQGTQQAAFAPWDDIEGLIVGQLAKARRQVLVQAYLLTNRPITDALVAARQRGVDVRVLMDGGQLDKNSSGRLQQLRSAGVPVWLETRYRNAHNKVIVIDAALPSATVITGSFNFTWSAQHKNAENILVLGKNPPLAARYAANWERHRQDAEPAP